MEEKLRDYITVKELKDFLLTLPEELNEYELVNGEFAKLNEADKEFFKLDKPIITIQADDETKQLCFLHQTEEQIDEIINNSVKKEDENQ